MVCILNLVWLKMFIVSEFMLLVVLVIVSGFSLGVSWLLSMCSSVNVVVKLVVFRIIVLCGVSLVGWVIIVLEVSWIYWL